MFKMGWFNLLKNKQLLLFINFFILRISDSCLKSFFSRNLEHKWVEMGEIYRCGCVRNQEIQKLHLGPLADDCEYLVWQTKKKLDGVRSDGFFLHATGDVRKDSLLSNMVHFVYKVGPY